MTSRATHTLALVGFLLVVQSLGAGAQSSDATESVAPDRGIWQDVAWTDLDGRTWTAEELYGHVVVVDFWATWCAPCLAEMPNLRSLHETHKDDGLVLLGVALDAIDRRRLRSFLGRHGIDWPQVHEPQGVAGEAARQFEVEVVPAVLVVDPAGRVVARDLRGAALRATLEALLDIRAARPQKRSPGQAN